MVTPLKSTVSGLASSVRFVWLLFLWVDIIAIGACGKSEKAGSRQPALAAQWKATVILADQDTHRVVLDLDTLGGRWVGEFDLSTFGIENYPVEVAIADTGVGLYFTAMEVGFHGRLSADGHSLSGVAHPLNQQHGDFPVTFQRSGEPIFSKAFLDLEAAAGDSSAVQILADSEPLRDIFNRDVDHVRLLMLLAPS